MSEQQPHATRQSATTSAGAATDPATQHDPRALVSDIRSLWTRIWLVLITGSILGTVAWWCLWLGPDQSLRPALRAASPASVGVATGSLAVVLSLLLALFGRARTLATDELPTDPAQMRAELAQLNVLYTLAAVLAVVAVAAAATSVNFAFCVGNGRISTMTAYGISWLACVLAVVTVSDGGPRRDRLRGLVSAYWRERTERSRTAWGLCRSTSRGLGEAAFCWLVAAASTVLLVSPVRDNLNLAWRALVLVSMWLLLVYAAPVLLGFAASIGRPVFALLLACPVTLSFTFLLAVIFTAWTSGTWGDVWVRFAVLAVIGLAPSIRAGFALRETFPDPPRSSAVVTAVCRLIGASPRRYRRPRHGRLAGIVRRYRELAGIDPIPQSAESDNDRSDNG